MQSIIFISALFSLLTLSHFINAQNTDHRLFVLGNSTIDHRPPAIPTPNDETTVPYWLYQLSQEAGYDFATGGEYGFLTNHDDLEFSSQWGYDGIPGVWDSEIEPFADADISTILITTANFIQYEAPSGPHPLDANTTVNMATETILDWINAEESGVKFYLYENWPEMDLINAYPPTAPSQSEIDAYHQQTLGSFHDWWIEYQDDLLASRPDLNLRLIPVGSTLSKIIQDLLSDEIPFTELYEDSAPHGRATLYFLASLITYMGMYEEQTPSTFDVPDIVHEVVQDNYESIVDFIWEELTAFNDNNGESRVFCTNVNNSESNVKINVQLAGAYNTSTNQMNTQLWDDNLIPNTQPYNNPPWNYNGNESINPSINTPIVDWLLIEARDSNDQSLIETSATLLGEDGNIYTSDGSLGATFNNLNPSLSYYFVVRHRNHLDIMSAIPLSLNNTSTHDLSISNNVLGGATQLSPLNNGNYAMKAGDFDANGVGSIFDFNLYVGDSSQIESYSILDCNFDSHTMVQDFNLYRENASMIGVDQIQY